MNWKIKYYSKALVHWIDKMPVGMRARYARLTERMLEFGPNLGMPFTRSLGKGMFEIRIKSKEGISRIFYCTIKENEILMLHGFIKKTQKIPQKELRVAMRYLRKVSNDERA